MPHPGDFGFELYVYGQTATAARQAAFARRVLTLDLADRYELHVIDIDATPGRSPKRTA